MLCKAFVIYIARSQASLHSLTRGEECSTSTQVSPMIRHSGLHLCLYTRIRGILELAGIGAGSQKPGFTNEQDGSTKKHVLRRWADYQFNPRSGRLELVHQRRIEIKLGETSYRLCLAITLSWIGMNLPISNVTCSDASLSFWNRGFEKS